MNKIWKPLIPVLLLASANAQADATQCFSDKYHAYIDASVSWYQELAQLATQHDPALSEVSQWYVEERVNHFTLNKLAVDYYLTNQPSKVNTNLAVESWLQLTQPQVKALTERDDQLGQAAQASFADRQRTPHKQNYELRSALADILSDPNTIQAPLENYNNQLLAAEQISCE